MAMRLGTDDKKKRLIAMVLVPLGITAIAYIVWNLAGGSSYTPPPPQQIAGTRRSDASDNAKPGHNAQHLESASALDPTLHPERMALAENTEYTGTSRNIFSKDSLPPASQIEKPIASVRTGPTGLNGPPPPPPINLKFYGFAQQNGRKLVFLLDGEDIFIAGQGDIVDGRYKVVQIENTAVVVEDLSYNNEQTLPLQTS